MKNLEEKLIIKIDELRVRRQKIDDFQRKASMSEYILYGHEERILSDLIKELENLLKS